MATNVPNTQAPDTDDDDTDDEEEREDVPASGDPEEQRKAWEREHGGATTSTGEPAPEGSAMSRASAMGQEAQERRDVRQDEREAEHDARRAEREGDRVAREAAHDERRQSRGSGSQTSDEAVDREGAEAPAGKGESPVPDEKRGRR